jgi:hypothetical protein
MMTGPCRTPDDDPAPGQDISRSDVAGGVFQVQDVGGNVHISAQAAEHAPRGRLSFLGKPTFQGAVALLGLAAILIPGTFYVRERVTDDPKRAVTGAAPSGTSVRAAKVEVVDMLVDTPKDGERRPVSLDIKVLNTGTQRSIIKRAVVTIRKFSMLTVCAGEGGGLDVSATYGLKMPTHPIPGQRIEIPVSQQIGPDEADRFKLNLRLPEAAAWVGGNPDAGKLFIYHIGVELVRDKDSTKLEAGEAVAALPTTVLPDRQEFFYTKEFARHPNRADTILAPEDIPEFNKCLKSNNAILYKFMSVDGAKPTWFSEIRSYLAK